MIAMPRSVLSAALLAVMFCTTTPSVAQELIPPDALSPDPGRTYAVKDVAANDWLNVRSQPGTQADTAVRLAPGSRGILLTGRRMAEGKSVWWEVITQDGPGDTGWVNHRYLAAEAGDDPGETSYPLLCAGTEPFWSLRLDGGHAIYSDPETEAVKMSSSGWIRSLNSPAVLAVRLRDEDGAAGNGHAAIQRSSCSDRMSDFEYPFGVTLILPDQKVLDGCCSRAASP
jgi:uncharacterized membrane protein